MLIKKSGMVWLVPFFFIVAAYFFSGVMFPVFNNPHGYDPDPAYVYLFNGVGLLYGHVPGHIDHPGTTLQMLVAAIVFASWKVCRLIGIENSNILTSVLNTPEFYIRISSATLIAINFGALLFFGKKIHRVTKNINLAVSAQALMFLPFISMARALYLAPESLLMAASLVFSAIFMEKFIGTQGDSGGVDTVKFSGALFGFCVATKFTFIPMATVFLLLKKPRDILLAIVFSIISFLIFTLPIIKRFHDVCVWLVSILIHSGRYGTGPGTIINTADFINQATGLIESIPAFYGELLTMVPLIMAGLLFRMGAFQRKISLSGPSIVLLTCLAQTLLVIKHPGIHYMIPVFSLGAVAVVLFLYQVTVGMDRRFRESITATLAGLILFFAAYTQYNVYRAFKATRLAADARYVAINSELEKYPGHIIIGTYRCLLLPCAIDFGLGYAPRLMDVASSGLSNYISFNIFNSMLYSYEGIRHAWVDPTKINDIIARNKDVFLVSPEYPQLKLLKLEKVLSGQDESLYRVMGVSERN